MNFDHAVGLTSANEPDIFDYVLQDLLLHRAAKGIEGDISVNEYIDHGRTLLSKTIPVGTTTTSGGLGLVLSNNSIVRIGSTPQMSARDDSVSFSVFGSNRGTMPAGEIKF